MPDLHSQTLRVKFYNNFLSQQFHCKMLKLLISVEAQCCLTITWIGIYCTKICEPIQDWMDPWIPRVEIVGIHLQRSSTLVQREDGGGLKNTAAAVRPAVHHVLPAARRTYPGGSQDTLLRRGVAAIAVLERRRASL